MYNLAQINLAALAYIALPLTIFLVALASAAVAVGHRRPVASGLRIWVALIAAVATVNVINHFHPAVVASILR